MSRGKGILVAMPERWDEACFSVPAIRALARAEVLGGIVCLHDQEMLWKTVTNLPRFTYAQKTSAGQLSKNLGSDWEASLAWENSIPAKAFVKAHIARRIGPTLTELKKLLTHPLDTQEKPTEHRVRLYLNTAEKMGIETAKPEFFMPASIGVPAKPKSVLLCPDSDFGPSHEWPLDRWQLVADSLLEQGRHLTIAGGIGGRNLGKILQSKIGGEADFLHANPFGAAIPSIAAFQCIIAADGSLPHLAAFTGGTCVTLFGPNDPNWKRPLGKQNVVVKHHVECSPCLSQKCLLDSRCQSELQVADVLNAIG
jgi:heptosyltransferase-2